MCSSRSPVCYLIPKIVDSVDIWFILLTFIYSIITAFWQYLLLCLDLVMFELIPHWASINLHLNCVCHFCKIETEWEWDETQNIELAALYPNVGGALSWRYETCGLFDPIQDYVKNPEGI